MAEDKYQSPQEKIDTLRSAEAVSRRDESKANIMAGRMNRMGDRFSGAAQDAAKATAESAKQAQEAREKGVVVDKSGTPPPMSDSRGNYAPTPDVANTGGVGVEASNSTEGGDQAKDPEQVDLEPAGVGITDGNEQIGDTEGEDEDGKPKRGRKPKP